MGSCVLVRHHNRNFPYFQIVDSRIYAVISVLIDVSLNFFDNRCSSACLYGNELSAFAQNQQCSSKACNYLIFCRQRRAAYELVIAVIQTAWQCATPHCVIVRRNFQPKVCYIVKVQHLSSLAVFISILACGEHPHFEAAEKCLFPAYLRLINTPTHFAEFQGCRA